MAGGKRQRSSRAKKNKSRKNDVAGISQLRRTVPLDEAVSQAESAMEMSDLDAALKLFAYASGLLRSRLHANDADGNSGATAKHENGQDRLSLSTVLGRMGEIKALNGEVESARADFLDAIELLGPLPEITALSSSGEDKIELGEDMINFSEAKNSETRAGLYLYLGQLSSGMDALASFRVGVKELGRAVLVLERICSAGDGTDSMEMEEWEDTESISMKQYLCEIRRQLCAAHCSVAELYLTDLCEEPDAESSCEEALQSALALGEIPTADKGTGHVLGLASSDAFQTMANLRLSQSRVQEALTCILKAYDTMKVGCEAMSELVGLGNDLCAKGDGQKQSVSSNEFVEVDAASSLPAYNFRCQTAKIMLECASLAEKSPSGTIGKTNQCAESAIQVLGSLLAENDEVIEVWYLLGCAFMACTPPNKDSAHYYWENALAMLIKTKEEINQSVYSSFENGRCAKNELEVIECQISDIKKKLGGGNACKGKAEEMVNS